MGWSVEKLTRKIYHDNGIICDPSTFKRTYAGYWQRSAGAFSWTMCGVRDSEYLIVGSIYPVTALIRKNCKIVTGEQEWNEIALYPEN